ncbi:dehydrogenase with different specificitie [Sarocladium strictum]
MDRFNADTDTYRTSTVRDLVSLAGKTVVVTGAARGLGLSAAVGCAEIGGTVIILDVLDEPTETLQTLASENGITLQYYRADVSDLEALSKVFDLIKQNHGPVNCLVNAAGIGPGGPFVECEQSTIERILAINVQGTMFASQLALKHMKESGRGGAIVNISSIGAHGGIPGQQNAVYCASKGAVSAFTRSLAIEYAQQGVRINSVSPGFFLAKMTPGYLEGDVARLRSFESIVPMGRFADRSELKSIVAFLLTPASSYITGEDILVDGGVQAA